MARTLSHGSCASCASCASACSEAAAERINMEREEAEEAARIAEARERKRRGSKDGPSVPPEFREAASAESDSRNHEWRQKLLRLAVGGQRGANASGHASASASAHASPGPRRLSDSHSNSPALQRRSATPSVETFGGINSYVP